MKLISSTCLAVLLLAGSNSALAAGDAKHFPGVFVGATNFDGETEFTYGIEYEYKFDKNWGVGAVYEKTDDAHHHDGVTVQLAQLFYHPISQFRIGIGAGKEKIGGDHPHSETLYRVSASYEYHIGDFGLAPTVAIDSIDGEQAYVFGVAIVRPF